MNKRVILILTAFLFILHSGSVFAEDLCELSESVSKKGLEVFKADKKKGIKLLEKAKRLCGSKTSTYHNLGVAYYAYGNLAESEKNFRVAVERSPKNANLLNNLAWVVLQRGHDPKEALRLAKKALGMDSSAVHIHDTVVRAIFASGRHLDALDQARKLEKKFSRSGEIKTLKKEITGSYLSHYADLVKSGRTDKGLLGLKEGAGHQDVARMHCLVLLRLGRGDKALDAAERAAKKFGNRGAFGELLDQAISSVIAGLYRDFKSGNPAVAVQSAKMLSEARPGNREIKKAYDKLFNAFLEDAAEEIQIPGKAQVASSRLSGDANFETIISGIGKTPSVSVPAPDLTDDLVKDIPRAKKKNRHGVALLIGNQRYAREKRGLSDVNFAERDVAVMKKYLEKTLGYDPKNIISELNVTSGDMRNLIGTDENPVGRLHNFIRQGKSDVFIYYVGHGGPGPEGKSAYLVPVDSQVDFIQNNGYSLNTFYNILEKLPAKRVTVVLDACFSGNSVNGPVFRNISPAMLQTISPVRKISKTAIFCGAKKDQVSTWYQEKRHSLFTYFFLNGLKGAADNDKNRKITLLEMKDYLEKEVPYWARRESNRNQNPLVEGNGDTIIAELTR